MRRQLLFLLLLCPVGAYGQTGQTEFTSANLTGATSCIANRLYVNTALGKMWTRVGGVCSLVTGTGDMVGPASSTDNELPLFSLTTGKILKRSNSHTGYVKVASGVVSAAVIPESDLPSLINAAKIADGSVTNAEFQRLDATSSIQTQLDSKAPIASPTFTGTVSGITKSMVGLGNVDNTSDATKNAATATLTNKTLTAPVINSPTGIVKADVGLGNVDNTSDATKNAASVTLTNKTIAFGSNTFTGTLSAGNGGFGADISSQSGVPLFASGTPTFTSTSGTGNFARVTSPTFVTPTLGAATATTINGNTLSTGTYTLTGGSGKTLTFNNSLTFAGTDGTTQTFQATGTVVNRDSTDTLTNKTYDTEGTGNIFTSVHKTWFAAAGCNNATAASFWDLGTSLAPTPTCKNSSSGNAQNAALDFPDSDGMYFGQTQMMLPEDFTGTVDAKIKWMAAATSGDVIWNVSTICVADGETDAPAFNTASTVTDTAKGTTLQLNDASITTVTITGCAAGELMHIKISRDRTTSGDTITGVVSFLGLQLTTRRQQ